MRIHRHHKLGFFALALALCLGLTPTLLNAQEQPAATAAPAVGELIGPQRTPPGAEPAPYDGDLQRLATILGSLHYLRNLCGEASNEWRGRMETMLIADKMEGERRARAVASFNDGYRAFSETYAVCNVQATAIIERFQDEGATLSSKLLTKFRS
jgi:uncharacterized protein (TIGR02301 family)